MTDLFEVSLVEGTDCDVVLEGEVAWLQLEVTLKTVLGQLPPRQEHIHQTPGRREKGGGEGGEQLLLHISGTPVSSVKSNEDTFIHTGTFYKGA